MNEVSDRACWRRQLHVLLVLLCAVAPAAMAAGPQQQLVSDYLQAAGSGGPSAMIGFYLISDVEQFRSGLLKKLDEEASAGRSAAREQLFGPASSLEELRRLTPTNFLLAVTRRVDLPAFPAKKVKVFGFVEESSDRQHAVARVWEDEKGNGASRLALVTVVRYGKDWRIALPESFRARVEAAMAGPPQTQRAAASTQSAPNTPEIVKLLDESGKVLRDGDCAKFFNEYMSPGFRGITSEKALKTLIAQCKARDETRETYLSALELARRLVPVYDKDRTRAVYDMSGQGLPFDRFTLERVGDRWYVAE
jgi:hypothetical protein